MAARRRSTRQRRTRWPLAREIIDDLEVALEQIMGVLNGLEEN